MIGHVLRQDRESDCNIAMTWTSGGRKKRGRPKTTWRRMVEQERGNIEWRSWDEAQVKAADRNEWKNPGWPYVALRHKEDMMMMMVMILYVSGVGKDVHH